MIEQIADLKQRLVVGRKRHSRNCYDPQAKRELIEACLRPGVSVAKLALTHGINADLLRSWMTKHQRQLSVGGSLRSSAATPAPFIPVVTVSAQRTPPCESAFSGLTNVAATTYKDLAPPREPGVQPHGT